MAERVQEWKLAFVGFEHELVAGVGHYGGPTWLPRALDIGCYKMFASTRAEAKAAS